jgi:cytochrome c-type biogenesis protein CcmH/NrfG
MDRAVLLVAAAAAVSVAGAMAIGAWMTTSPPSPPSPAMQATAAPSAETAPTADEIAARIRGLEERLERTPDDLAGWKMLGRSYMTQGRYMEAVGAYSRAAQIDARDPEVAGALKQLETIARNRGRHDEAVTR